MSEPLQKGILSFLQLDGTPQTLAGAARVYEKGSRLSRRRYSCAGKASAGSVDLASPDTCCAFVLVLDAGSIEGPADLKTLLNE